MNEPIINDITRTAFAAVINHKSIGREDQFMLGLAEEGTAGYWPQPQHGTFATYELASDKAEALNTLLFKLSREDAARIVASSMFRSNRRRTS